MPELNERLAKAVRNRMDELGVSQATGQGRGGPSTTSLTKITSGAGYIQGSQLGKLDAGLQWPSGTAARILRGGSTLTTIADVSDEELLAEVARRMQGRPNEAGNAEAEESPGEAVTPNVTPEAQTLAARRGDSRGKSLHARLDDLEGA